MGSEDSEVGMKPVERTQRGEFVETDGMQIVPEEQMAMVFGDMTTFANLPIGQCFQAFDGDEQYKKSSDTKAILMGVWEEVSIKPDARVIHLEQIAYEK